MDEKFLNEHENKTFLDDQFCIRNRMLLFETQNFSLFQDDDLNKLLCHLREYSIYSALNRDYSEAKKSDLLFDQIQNELSKRNIPSTEHISKMENSFEKQKREEILRIDEELNQFDNETIEKRNQLLNKQIEDSNEFEWKWRIEKPPKYRKPSSRLLFLLSSEKRLARIGEYDEAESYKAESDKLIEIERNKAQNLLNSDYKTAKSNFLKRQEEEFQLLNDSRQQQRDLLMAKKMALIETMDKRQSIIVDRMSMFSKEIIKEEVDSTGNEWMKYGTGGNIAKAMYDDHITIENPIPPLAPPNEGIQIKQKNKSEIRKNFITSKNRACVKNDRNFKKSETRKTGGLIRTSQKSSPRLNSVCQVNRRDGNREISSGRESSSRSSLKRTNNSSNLNSTKNSLFNRSIKNKVHSSFPDDSSKSSDIGKSKRLSSVSSRSSQVGKSKIDDKIGSSGSRIGTRPNNAANESKSLSDKLNKSGEKSKSNSDSREKISAYNNKDSDSSVLSVSSNKFNDGNLS